jgi:ribosomal protein L35
MRFIGPKYKTHEGASKRSRFEDAHQSHLIRRYKHRVVKFPDHYRVVRVTTDSNTNQN